MTKTVSIPFIYHQTTVLALDDDVTHLNTMKRLIHANTPYLMYDDPRQALAHLRSHTYQPHSLAALLTHSAMEMDVEYDSTPVYKVDFSRVYASMCAADRFEKVCVVFVDQSMPKMDGLDFCRLVRKENLAVKLVLLTGNAGSGAAIEAFNEGIIDAYLPKDHDAIAEVVNEHIVRYSWEQFSDLSANLPGLIPSSSQLLSDTGFVDFFQKTWKQHDKSEFYLCDVSGSFLLVTAQGAVELLLIRRDSDFTEIYELASESSAPRAVLQTIESRQCIPVAFENPYYLKIEGDRWENTLVSVKKIPNHADLYYAVVPQNHIKVFSLHSYINEVWMKNAQ